MKTMFLLVFALIMMTAFLPGPAPEENLTDARDGKVYKTVKIGDQVWMAENLCFNGTGSKCFKNSASYCEKYGRLYQWEQAKVSCPEGWHLPSREEWEKLVANYTDNEAAYKSLIKDGTGGFNATLHGVYDVSTNQFITLNQHGAYWTSTEFNKERAWAQRFLENTSDTYPSQAIKVNGQACRCVKN